MRIRKNAKTSAFLHATSIINHQTTLCLLNQSPWDIVTFPASTPSSSSSTSIHLFDDFVTCYNLNASANWSSPDSNKPIIQSVASTKNSNECEYDVINENVDEKIRNYESYEKEDKLGFMKGCVKQEDNFVDIQNDAVWVDKKKAQTVSKSCGSKKRAVYTSKQNEFYYYYSGFGPSWNKKRGCTTFNACGTNVTTSSDDGEMDVDVDKGKTQVGPVTTTMKTMWSCQVMPGEQDEQHGKDKEKSGKKRGRKPIKARSLKSLM